MKPNADYWIEKLQLEKHPEGGSFRETYRAALEIERAHLPKKFSGQRNISTSIYFLLQKNEFSAFHRIASDELWHFYYGGPLAIFEIDALTGSLFTHQLGGNFKKESV